MVDAELIRAWKNPAFRASLSESEVATLLANPAGMIELSASDLCAVGGGAGASCAGGGKLKSQKSGKSKRSHKSNKSNKSGKSQKSAQAGGCVCFAWS